MAHGFTGYASCYDKVIQSIPNLLSLYDPVLNKLFKLTEGCANILVQEYRMNLLIY